MPDQPFSGVVPASGNLTITILTRPQTWRVTQVSVKAPGVPSGSTCELQKNGVFITKIRASGGAAGGDPPVDVSPNDNLQVVLTGQTPGSLVTVNVFYEDRTNAR